MKIRGALERKDSRFVSGWIAVDDGAPTKPQLDLMIDDRRVARIDASIFRQDVKDAGFGDGCAGFAFRFGPDIEEHDAARIVLRFADTDLCLTTAAEARSAKPSAGQESAGSEVFILGSARSGTSIMFRGLHDVLGLPGLGESHVVPIFQRMLFAFYQYAEGFKAKPDVFASRLDVRELGNIFAPYLRRFYFQHFQGGGFVDKTPGLEALTGVPFIRQAFPTARFIVMSRSGIEVVESYRRKFSAGFEDACTEWARCAAEIATLRRDGGADLLFVNQFDLRTAPGAVAARVAAHLERRENADLAEFFGTQREDVLSDQSAWGHTLTLSRVNWSPEERKVFVGICAEAMVEAGFPL